MNITYMLKRLCRSRLKYIYSWGTIIWILSNFWLFDDMTNWLIVLVNLLLTGESWDWGIIETGNCWASRQGWADEDCRWASDLREGEEGNGYQVERNPSMSPWILISQKPGNIMFLPDPWTYLYWMLCWRSPTYLIALMFLDCCKLYLQFQTVCIQKEFSSTGTCRVDDTGELYNSIRGWEWCKLHCQINPICIWESSA